MSDGAAPARRWVSVRPSRAGRLLGYPVTADDARAVFDDLGMAHRDAGEDALEVEVPGYRPDIEREVDLIEEIVRVQGYDRVGSTLPRAPHAGGVPDGYARVRRAKELFVRAGLREIRPAPFASRDDLDLFGDTDAVPIANPLRAEESWLRTRLTPGLLRAVARERDAGAPRAALFEVGTTFRLADPFTEHRKAGFALAGAATDGWDAAPRDLDVLDAKGVLTALLDGFGVDGWALGEPPGRTVPPGPGRLGRSSGAARSACSARSTRGWPRDLGIDGRVSVGVVGLGSVADAGAPFAYRDVPRFPPVRRDLAFALPEDVPAGDVAAAIRDAGGDLLEDRPRVRRVPGRGTAGGDEEPGLRGRVARLRPDPHRRGGRAGDRRDRRGGRRAHRRDVADGRGLSAGASVPRGSGTRLRATMPRDYLSVDDLTPDELARLLDAAAAMKADRSLHADALAGRSVAMIFEKSSTRTRVSFDVGRRAAGRPPADPLVGGPPARPW